MQSIEDGHCDEASALQPGWLRVDPLRYLLPNPLARPSAVEVFGMFLDYPMKLPVSDNQQVIEAFFPQALQESFVDRVGLWSAAGYLQNFYGACRSDMGETVALLAVPVPDGKTWGQAVGSVSSSC